MQPAKILLIRPRRIGDIVLSTAIVRSLRLAFPAAELHFVVGHPCHQVLVGNPHLNRVILYPTDRRVRSYLALIRTLRRERYDIAIDLEGTRVTGRVVWASRAKVRIGYDYPVPGWAYTVRVPPERHRRYWLLTQAELLEPLGVKLDSLRTELFLSDTERESGRRILGGLGVRDGERLAAMVPGSEWKYKIWPAERFAEVADNLVRSHGLKIVLLHGRGEESYVRAVQSTMQFGSEAIVPKTPTLREAAAVLERCSIYVGNDVGTRHMAIALGLPTVGVFAKDYPERWTPPDATQHRSAAHDPGCKANCTYRTCKHLSCIDGIPADAVLAQVERLLAAPPPSALPAAYGVGGPFAAGGD